LKAIDKGYFSRHFVQGQPRTIKAKRNIVGLFVLRAVSTLTNFLLVPLTLHYLNPTRYGIWLTLTSIVTWVNVLDIGLGTGLRNKFAEAVARGEHELARSYVSTSYAFISLFALGAVLIFWVINPFLHWAAILNTPQEMNPELRSLALVAFTCFFLRVVFSLIGTILVADQRPAMNNMLDVLVNVLALGVVFLLTRSVDSSLFWVGSSISIITAVVPLTANIWYFRRKYVKYLPSLKYVKVEYARELMGLGIKFFIIQMAGIFIFASSNIIITQFFGPAEVTPYNIAFKYYGAAAQAFLMIITPFWSAYTDAYTRGDTGWIIRTNKKLRQIWGWQVAAVVVMTLASPYVYRLWVGESVRIPWLLSMFMGAYVLIVAWSNIFAYFINSTGKLRLQLWVAVGVAVVNIALSVLLARNLGLGSTGVVLATCLALLPGCFAWPVQMKKLLAGETGTIWTT
jgi:O-antigen/teichoic acid export membrane protein